MALLNPDGQRPRRFKTPRTVMALMLREMSSTYGRSPGGYIWAILEPVGGIAMLTLIMVEGLRLRNPSLGISFPLFYATGMLPFTAYQNLMNVTARAIPFSRPLLFYPGVTFIDTILARFILSMLTKVMVFYVVVGSIMLLFETRAQIDLGPILLSMTMTGALGLGVGCLNGYLIPTFPLWDSLWGIVTTPLFFVSAILFIYEDMPPLAQQIFWYNPLVHIIGMMRRGFYPDYDALYVSPAYVFGFGLITLTLGLVLLGRYYRDILNR